VIDYYNGIIGVMARFEVTKSDTELIKVMAKQCKNLLYANMILQHLAGTIQDFEAICKTIGKVQSFVQMAEGRRKYTWPVLKVQREIQVVFVGTARKGQDTSARIALNAKPSKVDLDLDLGRNVPCVERMDIPMLTVGKSSLIKLLNGTRI
jgi:hypothetical protein